MSTDVIKSSRSLVDVLVPRAQMQSLPGPTDDYWYGPVPARQAGQNVTQQTALTFSGCWAATNAIAGLFGAMPYKTYKKIDGGREEATKHDTYRILSREPNADMDSFIFWEMMTQWWVNYGNAFAEIQRYEDSDRIFALWPIHPSRVRPERDGERNWTGRWLIRNNNWQETPIDDADMLNIVGNLSDDGLIGKGVVMYAAQAIGLGMAQGSYGAEFFGNGGRPSGILEHPGTLKGPARDQLRREWKEIHGKSNEVAILWEGMKFNTISVAPEHAELNASQVFSIQEMCRFYDLPPHVLYELSKGTFANTEEMGRFLVSQPFNKRMVRVEKAVDRKLFSESEKRAGYYSKFNVDALLRGAPKERAELNAILLQNGVINQDEWRAQDERNSLPDGLGKKYWIRRDMATTDFVIENQDKINALPDGGAGPLEKPATPATPDTPPGNGESDAQNRVKELESELSGLKASFVTLESDKSAISGQLTEATALVETLTAERDAARQLHGELSGTLSATAAERDAVVTKLAGVESVLESTQNNLQNAQNTIATLESTVSDAESVKNTLSAQVETLTASLADSERSREVAVSKANKRGDDLKARVDTLSSDLGTAKAQAELLRDQSMALTKSRDELVSALSDVKNDLKDAQHQAETWKKAEATARNEFSTQRQAARMAMGAAMRALLDESLTAVLADEQEQARKAARSPEQFKQIINGYQHHLGERLTAQLSAASKALEALGAKPLDTAKLVSQYVADSRTRLNNVFNTTNRADLRVAIRKETESWEGRAQMLTDWIGQST